MTAEQEYPITLVNVIDPRNGLPLDSLSEPLGILYIAAYAKRYGYDTTVKDLGYLLMNATKRHGLEQLCDFCCNRHTRVLAISCMSAGLPLAILIAERCRKMYPDLWIIMGGHGPTILPRGIKEKINYVDYIVEGEGEKAFVGILDEIYRGGKRAKENSPQIVSATSCDLDEIPCPDRSTIPAEGYFITLSTSRGCPYNCTYCASKLMWKGKMKIRTPISVMSEIEDIVEKLRCGIIARQDEGRVVISDDTFIHSYEWLKELSAMFSKNKTNIQFTCYSRIEQMNDNIALMLKNMGCVDLKFGVESGSNKVLREISTKKNKEIILEVCSRAKEILGVVSASFIYGFPFETLDDFMETVSLVKELTQKGIRCKFNPLVVYPGTDIYCRYSDGYELVDEYVSKVMESESLTRELNENVLELIMDNPEMFLNFMTHRNALMNEKWQLLYTAI